METRANYTQVGLFVLLGFISMFIFVLWLNKASFGHEYKEYHILFTGAVTGLKKGAVVQYRGVPIGTVQDIVINKKNVEQIRVKTRINSNVTIREDMIASLETQGLTGVAYIQINGGTQESPPLTVKTGENYPIIPSKSSLFEEFTQDLPALIKNVGRLVDRISTFFDTKSKDSLPDTLKHIDALSSELSKTSSEFREILQENRPGFKEFSTNSLSALSKFLSEGRDSLSAIKKVAESLERSPSRFFYNDPKQGVPTQ